MKRFLFFGLPTLLVLSTSCRHNVQEPFHITGEAQGTYYSIIYYDSLGRDLSEKVKAQLDSFDSTASLWLLAEA